MGFSNVSKKPYVVTVTCTKDGSEKSTNAANIGAFFADHRLKTLLIDTDIQPILSSYYALAEEASGGIYEFLTRRNIDPAHIISKTSINCGVLTIIA